MAISEQILHPSGTLAPDINPPETVVVVVPTPPVMEAPIPVAAPSPVPEAPAALPAPAPAEDIPLLPEEPQAGAVVSAARSAWNWSACAARALNGLRTLLFFGVMGILALGAKFADVDLSGILSGLMGGKVDAADITVFMSIGGIVLRFLTTTQVFARWRKAAQGDKLPAASAAVDEPDESN